MSRLIIINSLFIFSLISIFSNANAAIQSDTVAPIVTAPANITLESTAKFTPVNLGSASATDNIDGVIPATADVTGPFEVDVHYITWTATDSSGNDGTAVQTVTITDTTPPILTVPADITVVSDIPIEIKIGKATGTDISAVNISHNAPDFFPVGTTRVTWTAIDDFFNSITAIQIIIVSNSSKGDTVSPVITAPLNIISEATNILTPINLGTA